MLIKNSGVTSIDFNYFTVSTTFIASFSFFIIISSFLTAHLTIKVMLKIIQAFKDIENGNFTVRLDFRKPRILSKTADTFNKMAVQLQKTEMMSSDFIDNFSHEMKTPISSINGFAKLIKSNDLDKATRDEYIDIIIQESESLSYLSQNILTLSRLQELNTLENKCKINITEQIRHAIASSYHKWSEKELDIDFESEEFSVQGNAEMLEQVWNNILGNAVKFSPDNGKINIRITSKSGKLYITVSNQGTPIPKENHDDIFKKFFRCEERNSSGGNGLGLPMVRQIILLHEGDMYVKKSDKTATVFEIVLPQT